MMTRIDITAEDIENGEATSCQTCPAALAISRHINCAIEVRVSWIRFGVPGNNRFMTTPELLARWISNFDQESQRHLCKPISFELAIPRKFLKAA